MTPRHLVLGFVAVGCLAVGCSDASPGTNDNNSNINSNVNVSICGDGYADIFAMEECDGNDLNGYTCQFLGYTSGTLACQHDCWFDRTNCDPPGICGNGDVEAPEEECDDGNLRSHDGCSSGCTFEHPVWVQIQTANAPNQHREFNMVFDQQRGVTVLFGGYNSDASDLYWRDETWEYDGTDWVQIVTDATPPGRGFFAMAYDWSRGRTVLFGGVGAPNTSTFDDTWEYNGTTWTEVSPATSPPATSSGAMAFDPVRGVAVLFGGDDPGAPIVTWEYDGAAWTEVVCPVNPDLRSYHSMEFDPSRQRVLLHGGMGPYSDVWEYDGLEWTELVESVTPSPDAKWATGMVFDERANCLVRFGGITFGSADVVGEMHRFNGAGWVDLHPENPPPARALHRMVYDTARQTVVLFGGMTEDSFVHDTWEYHWASDWPDEVCDNNADDDSDGLADCADPDCTGVPPC